LFYAAAACCVYAGDELRQGIAALATLVLELAVSPPRPPG